MSIVEIVIFVSENWRSEPAATLLKIARVVYNTTRYITATFMEENRTIVLL